MTQTLNDKKLSPRERIDSLLKRFRRVNHNRPYSTIMVAVSDITECKSIIQALVERLGKAGEAIEYAMRYLPDGCNAAEDDLNKALKSISLEAIEND